MGYVWNMRLFIAIRLSDEVRKALLSCMRDMKRQGVRGNYVPAENLHLTLAFIGEYDDPARVKKAIESIPGPKFSLKLSECGNFGNLLWAGVEENRELNAYVKELRGALRASGVPFDSKKFVPHITLVRKAARKPGGTHLPKAEMRVTRASLMKSEIKNGKVVYEEYAGE